MNVIDRLEAAKPVSSLAEEAAKPVSSLAEVDTPKDYVVYLFRSNGSVTAIVLGGVGSSSAPDPTIVSENLGLRSENLALKQDRERMQVEYDRIYAQLLQLKEKRDANESDDEPGERVPARESRRISLSSESNPSLEFELRNAEYALDEEECCTVQATSRSNGEPLTQGQLDKGKGRAIPIESILNLENSSYIVDDHRKENRKSKSRRRKKRRASYSSSGSDSGSESSDSDYYKRKKRDKREERVATLPDFGKLDRDSDLESGSDVEHDFFKSLPKVEEMEKPVALPPEIKDLTDFFKLGEVDTLQASKSIARFEGYPSNVRFAMPEAIKAIIKEEKDRFTRRRCWNSLQGAAKRISLQNATTHNSLYIARVQSFIMEHVRRLQKETDPAIKEQILAKMKGLEKRFWAHMRLLLVQQSKSTRANILHARRQLFNQLTLNKNCRIGLNDLPFVYEKGLITLVTKRDWAEHVKESDKLKKATEGARPYKSKSQPFRKSSFRSGGGRGYHKSGHWKQQPSYNEYERGDDPDRNAGPTYQSNPNNKAGKQFPKGRGRGGNFHN